MDSACKGGGDVTEVYVNIIERLHREQPIDVILIWSENGAVREFSRRHKIPVLFGELGPTRAPFPQTMYFDPQGTNGNAFFRESARKYIEQSKTVDFLPAGTWLVPNERQVVKPEETGSLIDSCVTYSQNHWDMLPERPYVYIAMQLADDLNTLLHSKYHDPREFLKEAVEMSIKNGYAVVVKGHPAASYRPYNLRKQVEALVWLETEHPDATILPATCSQELSVFTVANAAYTISINSSVGFESMILGVPTLVLGEAAFDAGAWLQKHIYMLPVRKRRGFHNEINAITSTYMKHILVPKDVVMNTDYLYDRLSEACQQKPVDISVNDYSAYYAFEENCYRNPETLNIPFLGANEAVNGMRIDWDIKEVRIFNDSRRVTYTMKRDDSIFGFVESISEQEEKMLVTGWVLDSETMTSPMAIMVVKDYKVVSSHAINRRREDIKKYFDWQVVPCCGFKFEIDVSSSHNMSLVVRSFDGSCSLFLNIAGRSALGIIPPRPTSVKTQKEAKVLILNDSIKFTNQDGGNEKILNFSARCFGKIEHFRKLDGDRLEIVGWVLDAVTKSTPKAINFIIGDSVVSREKPRAKRQDVIQRHQEFHGNCGFNCIIPFKNKDSCTIVIETEDGCAHLIKNVNQAQKIQLA